MLAQLDTRLPKQGRDPSRMSLLGWKDCIEERDPRWEIGMMAEPVNRSEGNTRPLVELYDAVLDRIRRLEGPAAGLHLELRANTPGYLFRSRSSTTPAPAHRERPAAQSRERGPRYSRHS
jgi:hypothetical protein